MNTALIAQYLTRKSGTKIVIKNPNRPAPGSSIKVDPIRTKKAIENIKSILSGSQKTRDLCLFTLGINTAFRANELLSIRAGDVRELKPGDTFELKQRKNQKHRQVTINKTVSEVIQAHLFRHSRNDDEYLFYSQRGDVLTVPSVTRLVKGWCESVGLKGNYGSHTMRKTWGHWQYQRGTPIPLLMEAFGHSTQQQTLGYLGIQAKDIKQIYEMEL